MREPLPAERIAPFALCAALLAIAWPARAATDSTVDATPAALAAAMATRRSVLLGEVHDNAAQHALRVAALSHLVEAGARPAIAFEQFDRQRQADIDRVRREQPGDADALIAAAGGRNWEWKYYRPFVQLALEHNLPIVAANLSRGDATKVTAEGWGAIFDTAEQAALGLGQLPAHFVTAHEREVARGHCDLLPANALPAMARAQIARDIVLARSVRPYLSRGVVLLTGNGHARKDIGVPYWLSVDELRDITSIGLFEAGPAESSDLVDEPRRFDAVVETAPADRPDPCEALRKRLPPGS